MNLFRRQRHRSRVSFILIIAMLWSQVALASHSMCSLAMNPVMEAASQMDDCEHATPPNDQVLCTAHCNQGDQSTDTSRVPPIHALPQDKFNHTATLGYAYEQHVYNIVPPEIFRHRPTLHPASVLLI